METYRGKQTQLAVDNFRISDEPVPTPVIRALIEIKAAAAYCNAQAGTGVGLDPERADAIMTACHQLLDDFRPELFPVDVFQTGSGTSTNMNVNEVVAHQAAAILGADVHPNDHVNASQSTNDTFPTAIRLAALELLRTMAYPALGRLAEVLGRRAADFYDVYKAGRTHLMDATPVTVGQEFAGYRQMVDDAIQRLVDGECRLRQLPIGGTAVGTGLNTPPGFGPAMVARLQHQLGMELSEAPNHFAVQGSQDALVELSAQLRGAGIALFKIADDIRLMASGPRTGLAELILPELQPGSSIMPGKVNPVICEVVTQVAAQIHGNDAAVAFCGSLGTLELNTYLPVMARNLTQSITLLANATRSLADQAVDGVTVDRRRCRSYAEATLAVATALNPLLGYETTTRLVKRAAETGRDLRSVLVDDGAMSAEEVDRLLDLSRLVGRT